MKLTSIAFGLVAVVSLIGCGGAESAEPKTAASHQNAAAQPKEKTAAEEWAEKKVAAEAAAEKKEAKAKAVEPTKAETTSAASNGDPLATNNEIEESSIPKTDITPAKQTRAKSPKELNAALNLVKSASSVDEAAKKLTAKLGKPNWTESPKNNDNAKKRIWTAASGNQCHRLVLDADGSVEVETASKTEWRMLAASARQNPCTGEIKRGSLTTK